MCRLYKHVYDETVLITDKQNDSQVLLPTATATVNSPVTVTSINTSSTPTTSE